MADQKENIISTKANTLYAMKNLIHKARIEQMFILKVENFRNNRMKVCHEIMDRFNGCRIVVRSSSTQEDSLKFSNAGHYKSILDVDSASEQEILQSIDEVIASYQEDMESVAQEQILIQRQALDVCVSGVIFTRDLKGNRPYYLVNYDDLGSTDSVTSGRGGKMLWIAKNIAEDTLKDRWRALIGAVKEVESVIEGIPLDIEFAINSSNEVILFQVRPLAAVAHYDAAGMDDHSFFQWKDNMKQEYEKRLDVLTGKPMKLSDMAFWNPSEIIGTNPKQLDYSLYREIITGRAWNQGIVQLGYRRLDEDLMYQVGNKPYINLNYSFYALTPANIPENLALRLMEFYQKRLEEDLSAHDKIEFEIAYTSYDFMLEKNSQKMLSYGFTEEERRLVVDKVKAVTLDIIRNQKMFTDRDKNSLGVLATCRDRAEQVFNESSSVEELMRAISDLLDAIKKYGTPQFARQARMAFIARSFIRTLAEAGYYTQEQMDDFMLSISTVSSKFNEDFENYADNALSREIFNKKYGHLRSGTYDIRSDRYDAMNFRPVPAKNRTPKKKSRENFNKYPLERALMEHGIDVEIHTFIRFLVTAIEEREYFKFEFTKSLSLVLEMIRKIGALINVRLDDLSWITVENIRNYEKGTANEELKKQWEELGAKRKLEYRNNRMVLLPEVILSGQSLDIVPVYEARPNFITSKRVEGEIVLLEEDADADITGKIVVVTKADPGYEWIFTKKIKGFITKYGGAASHMAIRCAEFDIPAAIGCGEKIYDFVSKLDYVEMDCRNGSIKAGIQYYNLHALITQREGVNAYGDPTDILEAGYVRFYELMGFIPKAVSNHTKNLEKLFDEKIDLLIVVGGGSLDSRWYDRQHDDETQPNRDRTEEKLIKYCVEHKIPIVATCRGMQYINVLYGGKLCYHPQLPVKRPRGVDHPVRLLKENRTIMVNNFHQDIIYEDGLAPCFEPLAIDEENHVIEAYGSEEMKLLALQWHPERDFETAQAQDETRKIIVNFIQKYVH
jgi:gamma-glutamyl-gamma-aminobutyrate hydrolase PuuD/phosphohistidine swiveling domain-containing protein